MARAVAINKIAGKAIGPVAYGMMGLSFPWSGMDNAASAKVMKSALDQGANFWNGGMFYGTPQANSLHILKYYFDQYPEDADKVVLSIKGAYDHPTRIPDCSPEGICTAVEEALRVLDGVKKIDIFECARVDPKVPIEISVKALAELVAAGKIGGIGLSEVNAATIRKAHAVHPIAAVEIELSIFTPDVLTNGVADTCHELGIALVGYSPVSKGWLTGQYKNYEDLPEKGVLRMLPRFQPAVFDQNLKLAESVEKVAKRKGVAVAQVAINWARSYGAIPLPGWTKVERSVENCKDVPLSNEDLEEIQKALDALPVAGGRYPPSYGALLNQ